MQLDQAIKLAKKKTNEGLSEEAKDISRYSCEVSQKQKSFGWT